MERFGSSCPFELFRILSPREMNFVGAPTRTLLSIQHFLEHLEERIMQTPEDEVLKYYYLRTFIPSLVGSASWSFTIREVESCLTSEQRSWIARESEDGVIVVTFVFSEADLDFIKTISELPLDRFDASHRRIEEIRMRDIEEFPEINRAEILAEYWLEVAMDGDESRHTA